MWAALTSGLLLGLSCGAAPGPLLALVLAHTLRYGPREGCKIALAPVLTDAPIIAIAVLTAAKLATLRPLLGAVSIVGGLFVIYLAWDSLAPIRWDPKADAGRPRSWAKGILTNLLSPHPWLFWLTAGAALLAKAMAQSGWAALAFLGGFYLALTSAKVAVALLAARSRDWLAGPVYRAVLRLLALALAGFGLLLLREGWRLFDPE